MPCYARSVGCIFAELLLRRPLLMGSGEIDQIDKICKLLGSPTVEQWPGLADMPDGKLLGKKLSSKNVSRVRPHSASHRPAVDCLGLPLRFSADGPHATWATSILTLPPPPPPPPPPLLLRRSCTASSR